jgi:hypothetical protein
MRSPWGDCHPCDENLSPGTPIYHPCDEDLSPGTPREPPGRTGPVRSALMAPGVALPSLFGLAPCGVYPASGLTAGAVRSYRTISPLPRHRGNQPRKLGRRSRVALARDPTYVIAVRGSRGGIFSVALAVCGPSSPHPGRYPAHCPAEFGLSSPGSLDPKPPAATARSSCQS